ncbi:MAG: hypothetical protein CMJ67_10765 [Planctomycetaceae bacterium]|nr:hypothetical protein [Planctomycetaceae bacterium]
MTDRIAAAATILCLLVGVGVYYQKVVKPNDEARYAIMACMAEKGDLRGPESRRHYDECVEGLALR